MILQHARHVCIDRSAAAAAIACPLRARPDEHSRVVTVTREQCARKPAGRRICRWRISSATDFPS